MPETKQVLQYQHGPVDLHEHVSTSLQMLMHTHIHTEDHTGETGSDTPSSNPHHGWSQDSCQSNTDLTCYTQGVTHSCLMGRGESGFIHTGLGGGCEGEELLGGQGTATDTSTGSGRAETPPSLILLGFFPSRRRTSYSLAAS